MRNIFIKNLAILQFSYVISNYAIVKRKQQLEIESRATTGDKIKRKLTLA
jgi:hypothetical protein